MDPLVQETERYVRSIQEGLSGDHDFTHTERVRRTALMICRGESPQGDCSIDTRVVELTALLHDAWDHKEHGGDSTYGARQARTYLAALGAPDDVATHVAHNVEHLSFKGMTGPREPLSLEGQIVQDADRLDAIGAIGIARAFSYGGKKGRPLYAPGVEAKPQYANAQEYVRGAASTLHHFFEKLLRLKELMNTATARRMAEERHEYMRQYVEQFLEEWHGSWRNEEES